MNTPKKLTAALCAMALPLAACGDDESDLEDVDVDVTIDDTVDGSPTTIGGGSLPTVSTAPAGATMEPGTTMGGDGTGTVAP